MLSKGHGEQYEYCSLPGLFVQMDRHFTKDCSHTHCPYGDVVSGAADTAVCLFVCLSVCLFDVLGPPAPPKGDT